ncbi:MAG: hypothetical protein KJ000_16680 [Pirellulaceae bacterium]|nr:hypothetical protein [Pirellulaceae bacterium]
MVRGPFHIPLFLSVLLALNAQSVDAQSLLADAEPSPSDIGNDLPSGYGAWHDYDQPPEATTYHRPFLSHCDGWYAGVELVMVKPYWEDEVDTLINVLDPQEGTFALDPQYNCSLSPRIYVGHRDCTGFGGRVRYWYYDEAAKTLVVTDPDIQRTAILNASLNVQALDMEATKLLGDGLFSLEFGGGVRYGRTQVEASLEFDEDPPFGNLGVATFEGVGPTVFAEARHQLRHFKHLSVVGNLRGSVLFGKSNFSSIDTLFQEELINEGKDDLVPILESQIGIEYARNVGHGRLAARALMEGQWWGIATPGASFSRDLGGAGDLRFDRFNTGRDIGFFGITAAVIYDF